ncbi:MAG: hypothetical protein SFX73_03130 [Kofleriaceae bacterium]|nr:hypothetical protein [Kofleriaceae bacterium]
MTTLDQLFGARTAELYANAVDATTAARVREQAHFTRYALVDRGSYEHAPCDDTALLDRLVTLVSQRTGRALTVAEARLVRLAPGDYLLAHHDRVHDDLPLELVLDLSPATTPGAEVHYRRRGQVYFRVPSAPGTLSLVERGPTVTCNHTYVSKLHVGASVVRLIALLR